MDRRLEDSRLSFARTWPSAALQSLARIARLVLASCIALGVGAGAASAAESAFAAPAPAASDGFREAASFDRAFSPRPELIPKARASGTLSQVAGWFEYDVSIATDGWHELVLQGPGNDLEFMITDRSSGKVVARKVGSHGFDGKLDKVSNLHLRRGDYSIRIGREFWTGLPDIRGFWLRPSANNLGGQLRITPPAFSGVYRAGQCGPLEIEYGPLARTTTIETIFVDASNSRTLKTDRIELAASPKVTTRAWTPPCDSHGTFVIYFRNVAEGLNAKNNRDVHQVIYQVFDTRPFAPVARGSTGRPEARRTLLYTIDTVATKPDHESGTGRVVERPFGSYRESDSNGWVRRQHGGSPGPSWFAYALRDLEPQKPYIVEVDYPDDAERTFAIALREARPLSYPVAGGIDSGGEFRLTNRMQTHTLLFWPRSKETRVVFLPARDGTRAAASAIRVYRVEDALPPLAGDASGRRFWNWYEEGSNFLSMYGATDHWFDAARVGAERWVEAAAHMGITTLAPTVVIYEFGLFPSVVNRYFSRPAAPDMLRQILLAAEKRKIEVVPELHPRADEINWSILQQPDPRPTLLRSNTGDWNKGVPPFFNPLHPLVEKWYLDLVGELADNYRDSPAMTGISLRVMGWRNPTLHNFYSLDWGYDDFTIDQFTRDTGIAVPGGTTNSSRFASRHRFLTTTERARWIEWRTEKVAQIVSRIRDRVRRARPDMKVYLPVFPMTASGSTYFRGTEWIREAGIDVARLSKIDGVVLINALHGYGRRFDPDTNQTLRRNLVDREIAGSLAPGGSGGSYLPYAVYFEAIQSVASNEQLGFPPDTRRTWMSAVVNPSGRNYLERFALLLARHDAMMLGDGGNTYTIGQPELREFLSEYVRLPAERFTRRTGTDAPVAVWELRRTGDFHFYAVNATASPATIHISVSGTATVEQLGTGARLPVSGGRISLNLEPYQLVAFKAPAAARLTVPTP
jgi:hypothetical protein